VDDSGPSQAFGFLVVSDDPGLRDGLVTDLDRRFDREYRVVAGGCAATGPARGAGT